MPTPTHMPMLVDHMTFEDLCAMLEYLTEQAHAAETEEDMCAVMEIARQVFAPPQMRNAVQGLGHIRAELDDSYMVESAAKTAKDDGACMVSLEIPQILQTMFRDLSQRMNRLQEEDPETFVNATSALGWLANGNIKAN